MNTTGDELTLFNPDSEEEEYLIDSENEVHDLRRERLHKDDPNDKHDTPTEA